jgi:wyosine [tRNA(Phe)-imidazoG37] synthetase (radical SAM superfamily)
MKGRKKMRKELMDIQTGIERVGEMGFFDTLKSALEDRPLVLYGAAQTGSLFLDSCRKHGIEAAAFCDRGVTGRHEGIEVIDPDTLKSRFFDAVVIICSFRHRDGIHDTLLRLGFPAERIIFPWQMLRQSAHYGESRYRSCPMIENAALNFLGRIDKGDKCMTLCCESIDAPGITLCESANDSVESFLRMRAEIIAESVRIDLLGNADEPREFTAGCASCPRFRASDFGQSDGLIHSINLGMSPAPCQCKCVYCGFPGGKNGKLSKRLHADYYEKVFDVIDHAESVGHIAPNASWSVASGEITIHPYKDRILERVKNRAVTFHTNGFIFDGRIAAILSENPCSAINLSIDSGTPETWRKVKGVDNFNTVIGNLVKYRERSRPGQITLKYIVLPGMNDTPDDYRSVIEVMNLLGVGCLIVSCDVAVVHQYILGVKARETLIRAAGRLVATLLENGMTFRLPSHWWPSEQAQIAAFVHEWRQTGRRV